MSSVNIEHFVSCVSRAVSSGVHPKRAVEKDIIESPKPPNMTSDNRGLNSVRAVLTHRQTMAWSRLYKISKWMPGVFYILQKLFLLITGSSHDALTVATPTLKHTLNVFSAEMSPQKEPEGPTVWTVLFLFSFCFLLH